MALKLVSINNDNGVYKLNVENKEKLEVSSFIKGVEEAVQEIVEEKDNNIKKLNLRIVDLERQLIEVNKY